MRTAFLEQLIVEARRNPRLFLIVGDLGYSVVEPFAREFPTRFLNCGVAEQNMAGLAAGLASEGWHVFMYSIANFPTFRCAEQIRNDIAYPNLPVTIVAVGGGLSYGNLGYSHHAVQDIALLRTFPNVLMSCPGDRLETTEAVKFLSRNPQPSYLRLGRFEGANIHGKPAGATPGKLRSVEGDGVAKRLLLTTGGALRIAHAVWAENLRPTWTLCSLPVWSESCAQATVDELARFEIIVTVEDHLRSGGFGSYIRELLDSAGLQPKFKAIALSPVVCGMVGTQETLNLRGGLSAESMLSSIRMLAGIQLGDPSYPIACRPADECL
jgi:transketolase